MPRYGAARRDAAALVAPISTSIWALPASLPRAAHHPPRGGRSLRRKPQSRQQPIADERDHLVVRVVQVLEEDACHADVAKLLDPLGDLLDRPHEPAVAPLREQRLRIGIAAADGQEAGDALP